MKELSGEQAAFALAQMARQSDHRDLNLSPDLMQKVTHSFDAQPHLQHLLSAGSHLTQTEQELAFGDRLPPGLTLFSL
jgi:hypothetical protein